MMQARQFLMAAALSLCGWAGAALAQDTWVQIEARPDRAQAEARAADWAGRIDAVEGYALPTGWFAVAIGPYPRPEAAETLRRLRAARTIPGDAFLSDGAAFRERIFPPAGSGDEAAVAALPPDNPAVAALPPDGAAVAADAGPPDDPDTAAAAGEETPAEARAAERSLTRANREAVQRALGMTGFYDAAIDGDFGPGTRRAMAEWQDAAGFEATGVLTTRQRGALLGGIADARATLGIATVADAAAGLRVDLPLGVLSPGATEPPFVRYDGTDGARALLISQAGDRATLRALFDLLQTLEIVPPDGPRGITGDAFTLVGRNDRIVSETYATVADGAVKGITLVWPAGDELRRQMAWGAMRSSFEPTDGVLSGAAPIPAAGGGDLVAGLRIRRPLASGSGVYVTGDGRVLTAASVVPGCGRISIDGLHDGDLTASDAGLALIAPRARLAPVELARLAGAAAPGAEVAVAGYSYGGRLGAPTLTYGSVAAAGGLAGEPDRTQLSLAALDGDVGGPVLDAGGGVVGLLLAPPQEDGRRLPDGVQFAADARAVAGFLSSQGIDFAGAEARAALAPQDLALLGERMTVLVECWE